MKKLVVFFMTISIVFAQGNLKLQILNKIAKLFITQQEVRIFVNDEDYTIGNDEEKGNMISSCKKANFFVLKNFNQLEDNCIDENSFIIATKYDFFNKNPYFVGAIFWQKGRLNLIFRSERLEELKISLPREYEKYIE